MRPSWINLTDEANALLSSLPPMEEDGDPDEVIPHFWERSIGDHFFGQFSMAALKGRNEMEDRSEVTIDEDYVFFGVYDGHGGACVSSLLARELYVLIRDMFRKCVSRCVDRSSNCWSLFNNAVAFIEKGFLKRAMEELNSNPRIATQVSSCLFGVILGNKLNYANLGDSRAVLGYVDVSGNIVERQITQDHNVNVLEVQNDYEDFHWDGNEPLLMDVDGLWYIKGLIQVTRSIGDACFKNEIFARALEKEFPIPGDTDWLLLSSNPSVQSLDLKPAHRFVILATRGLWEHLSNREAAQLVRNGPRESAARRLVKRALRKAAIKAGKSYEEIKAVSIEHRRIYVDDISVIVLFVDHDLLKNMRDNVPSVSVRGFVGEEERTLSDQSKPVVSDEAGPSNVKNQESKRAQPKADLVVPGFILKKSFLSNC